MEKRKKWQLYLIAAIIFLTLYNILPTVFFYSKPLKSPIDEKRANKIAESIIYRVNSLEEEAQAWVGSFCKLLKIKPLSIALQPKDPLLLTVTFSTLEDAKTFRTYLPRAGALIPFVPAQLSLYDAQETGDKTIVLQRKIPLHFNENQVSDYYQYAMKYDAQGFPTPLYKALIEDRALQLGVSLGGPSENAQLVQAAISTHPASKAQDLLLILSQNILSFTKTFGEKSSITQRYFASFTQIDHSDRPALVQSFIQALVDAKEEIKREKNALQEESERLKNQGQFLPALKQQRLEALISKEKNLEHALTIVRRNNTYFAQGSSPLNYNSLFALIQASAHSASKIENVSLVGLNPLIESLTIDWSKERIYLTLYPDLLAFRKEIESQNALSSIRDSADQILYNEIAYISRGSGEVISPFQERFEIQLNRLTNSKSFLAMRLSAIAEAHIKQLKDIVKKTWNPQHPDLRADHFPIYDFETYDALPADQQKLALVIYAPAVYKKIPPEGLHMNAIYVIAKGMDTIIQRISNEPQSAQTEQFIQDFNHLRDILQQNGFVGYSGKSYGLNPQFAHDFIFEGDDYYQNVLKASREDFTVHGTKRYAILEFTDVEQRILTENKIDNRIHEDLLKSRDDYLAAQLHIKGVSPFDMPKPVRNVYWENFKLSFIKYFRGDDRKILHWGLDLSGGKTVQIELRDSDNRQVNNEADIRQGINELYNRVNKMGVSEVSIRQEGNYISLDFPGLQGLSASELIKSSSMQFHVVNEKFGTYNPSLSEAVNAFLQDVWNEAVVTNRKEIEDIQQIALKHLYGDSLDPEAALPRSESARTLYDQGLRLALPETLSSSAFNETYSMIARFRGDDFTDWSGQTHPLIIVFKNKALEGSDLENVQSSYDVSKGNFLSFSIKGSYTNKEGQKVNARDTLFDWTSHFAKEKVIDTPLEALCSGRGWRMAVILNGSIISAPSLDSPLRESAMISGSFTQREINQLEADLKAGSLSFTPHILSEMNVSPELGGKERISGILATCISLCLVIAAMLCYYRFGGLIASCAVLFNLFILWATLQNLQATMTLAGIAAIILTLGMAVDANVLVFERIREEFASSGRLATAVQAGYRKAFSAIIDSNVTTIIAALVLLHFDSGPIKGFAITLIIGIISSMITALFMTRYFFAGWVQNPAHKTLHMLNWFKAKKFDFLKYTKLSVISSLVIILIGGALLLQQRSSLFGMDFTGGYALTLDLPVSEKQDYRQKVESALLSQGALSNEFQIRELSPSNHLRIFLSRNLEKVGHPFFNMPTSLNLKEPIYPFENNPKIVWIVQALDQAGLVLEPQVLSNLDKSWVQVSGQMSETMRNSAIIGLSVALLAILIYITIRFEFKYAISATICIIHDVLFTLGFISLLHALSIPLQIDLNTVAALLTIVGYSLNDTIIVFDRIREDVRLMRRMRFSEVINHALNVTLSRTLMTSGTTLLVLLPLILFGGTTLFGFALVMAIGVIFGTLSSLFIASPLLKFFHDREELKVNRSLA